MSDDVATASAPRAARNARGETFIRATEVWTLDAATDRLTLSSGAYGGLDAFSALSGETSFARGEGLPGRAWAERRPIVLKGFEGSYFKRTEAAAAAGLSAGVAMPVFAGETLMGVLTFFCGDRDGLIGAIEVWSEKDDAGVMTLDDGYFGAAEHFEWVSRRTQFPRGQGLPGTVWETAGAVLFHDLGASHRFVRAESAGKAGLTTGLGVPVPAPGAAPCALTLLSARGAPIARRFEIWTREPSGAFALSGGVTEEGPVGPSAARLAPGHGMLGKVAETGAPLAADGLGATATGCTALVATPVYRDGALVQIAAWYF